MSIDEMSVSFDVYYNSITSNQAPGLTEYEKSLFLTKAEKEIVKNYFTPQSKGNNLGQGFDDSAKRQADFSVLMKAGACTLQEEFSGVRIDPRSKVYTFPSDAFIIINETAVTSDDRILQVVPIRYDEYTRLMSKPYQLPLKKQAWRLNNSGSVSGNDTTKYVEIVTNVGDNVTSYTVRYVRVPKPIILETLDGYTIDGESAKSVGCELDPVLHEDVVQRAVELAKAVWTSTGQDNTQIMMTTGQRTE